MRRAASNGCELSDPVVTAAGIRAAVDIPVRAAGGAHHVARAFTFTRLVDGCEHIALGLGPFRRPAANTPVVRIHSECLTGDVFGSRRCDCGPQLEESIALIATSGGYLLYLRQEGRGIGLYAKLDAYLLQENGLDTYAANRALGFEDDPRDYKVAAQMLRALGAVRVDLLTGNPHKIAALVAGGVTVRRVLPTTCHETPENIRYLAAKKSQGHVFRGSAVQREGGVAR
jgi:GTP cyclohydrolase II